MRGGVAPDAGRGTEGGPAGAAPGTAPGVQADDVDARELEALGRSSGITRTASAIGRRRLLNGGDPGLRDRDEVTDEVAVGAAGLTSDPVRRQLAQAREVAKPLGRLGMGGEQPMPPEADPLDQPADEDVGAHLAHRPGRGVVEAEGTP